MAELTLMKNAAEQQLAAEWQAAKAQAAGRRAAARGRVRALCRDRPAASARGGVEVHRSARADARRQAAGEPAGCRREGARQGCRRPAGGRGQPQARLRRWCIRAGAVRSRQPGERTDHPPDGAGARGGRCAGQSDRPGGQDQRSGGRAQHRLHGRRHRDPCRGRRRGGAADPSGVRRDRRQAGCAVHPLARRDREGRARDAGREP